MIVVTHLLGSGHLARAQVLGKAFRAADHQVVLVSGGMPADHRDTSGVDLVQLPALRSDGINFRRLLDQEGNEATPELHRLRREMLQATFLRIQPDVLITELFPFGRRVLKEEFKSLLLAAQSAPKPPLICASIRDILAPPSKPAKAEETQSTLAEFYDAVLVHSDPTVTLLDTSWPVTSEIQDLLCYTGFVANPLDNAHPEAMGEYEILVSAGGGNVGEALYETALKTAAMDGSRHWRLLVGGSEAPTRCAALKRQAPLNAIVEPSRPDFRQMLHHAAVSVSMCGYNTALDILQTGTRAVFVPFDAGGEVEQTLRARALEQLPAISVLPAADLTPNNLLDHVSLVQSAPARQSGQFRFDGAAETVKIVEQKMKQRGG